jgi:hypothetical protein
VIVTAVHGHRQTKAGSQPEAGRNSRDGRKLDAELAIKNPTFDHGRAAVLLTNDCVGTAMPIKISF